MLYCIDPSKQGRWHLHLCMTLQRILNLPEPPHFLVPCYTATIDHWLDPKTQQVRIFAEAYPAILQYQPLLNVIFNTPDLIWQKAPLKSGLCDSVVLSTYRSTFPTLWEDHDLIVRADLAEEQKAPILTPIINQNQLNQNQLNQNQLNQNQLNQNQQQNAQAYVLRLFVAGRSPNTERILKLLYELLEKYLSHPYTLKVIDVLSHPELAEANQISATPTLVKMYPKPIRRVIGDLDNIERILHMLGAKEQPWDI